MGKPESKIEARLCNGVKHLGGRAYKLVSPGCAGMPDRLVCFPGGKVFFVELKAPKGILSKLQKKRITELKELGQEAFVLTTPGEVDAFLQILGRGFNG